MAIELQLKPEEHYPPEADIFLESKLPVEAFEPFAESFKQYSSWFYYVHEDMIVDNVANILLAGINQRDELIDIDKKTTEDSLSLIFDCRQKDAGIFGWQVSRANQNGRTIEQLYTDGRNLNATSFRLDHQGKLRQSDKLDEVATQDLAKTIRRLAGGREVLDQSAEFIARKERAEREMGRYIIELEHRHSPDKYRSEITSRKKQIREIGFVSLLPYRSPK